MASRTWWLAWALAGLAACDVPAGSEGIGGSPLPTEPLELELGAGRTEFVELSEDTPTLEIVSGPQGGWHLEVTLQLTHYDGAPLVLDYQARTLDGRSLGFPAEYAVDADRLLEEEGGRFLRVGDRVILDVTGPEVVEGLEVRVICRASRNGQTLAETERSLQLLDEVDELR